MKISEVLEQTKVQPLAVIAKEQLSIGEKSARMALKEANCVSIVGQSGWFYEGDNPAELEKSIYEYSEQAKQRYNDDLRKAANVQTYEGLPIRKRHSFDLDVQLIKQLKLKCVQEDIPLYMAVEDAVRNYLKDESQ